MEKRKHILSMLLLVASCLFSTNAFASRAYINGIFYNLSGDEASVTYGDIPYYYSPIVIPESVVYNAKTYSVTSIGSSAFSGCEGLTSVTIPNSVTRIGSTAFYNCPRLTSITIPNSVTSIGYAAFGYCSGLTSVTIPNSVTSIGDYAFSGCEGLTSVTIGNSVTSIGQQAFDGCSMLTSITIPNSVTSIGERAFRNCSGLTSVTINSNAIASKKYISYSSLKDVFGQQVKTYILGGYVRSIGDYAFYGCSGLTSVTIPNSVTSIGDLAFEGCSGLTSVTINSNAIASKEYTSNSSLSSVFGGKVKTYILGDEVTSIGDYAFYDCSWLTSVTFGNSVTSIGRSAFGFCPRLTSVTIGNSVTSIGGGAFSGCSSLTSVTIPNSVTSIEDYAFNGCSSLTSVTIPNSVTSIGDGAFSGCSGLTSVTIPNSVTSIEARAFYRCSGLTSVNIGNGVKNIGGYQAFAYCAELTDVYCYAESVPSTKSDTFEYSNYENATLHVPAASIEQYKATKPWSNFGTIVPLTDEDAVAEVQAVPVLIQTQGNTITVEGAEAGTEIILYGANGVQLDSVVASTGVASLNTSRLSGSVAVVKIGDKTVKVLVKQ